jgi:hypothetical protein
MEYISVSITSAGGIASVFPIFQRLLMHIIYALSVALRRSRHGKIDIETYHIHKHAGKSSGCFEKIPQKATQPFFDGFDILLVVPGSINERRGQDSS